MSIQLDREITQDFARATGLEWLETNGLGGWAGTTVSGAHSRRYHGLLVAATQGQSPAERVVLLSRLDETLHVEGASFDLGCNQFPGIVSPRGFEYLTAFRKDLFPVFDYEAGGVKLRKTVAAVDGENTTLVLYEVVEAPGPFILSLRPFLAARDQHVLSSANDAVSQEAPFVDGVLHLRPYPEVPELFVAVPGADFRPNPQWWYRFEYELDRRHGRDFQEDLWTPGLFGLELAPGDRLGIVISTRNPAGRDALALFEKEKKRREKILKSLPVKDELARFLALAGDGFLGRHDANPLGDSHRDTLIALPGLYLATGRFEEAKKILRGFAKSLHKGLLPDQGKDLEIASPDASLWLAVVTWKYLAATGDESFVRETLLPALRKVVYACERGTFPGIRVDKDGLLAVGEIKAVAVNALWFNALSIQAEIEARLGDAAVAKTVAQQARRVQKRFQELFWNEEAGALYDVVNGEDKDSALRPYQLLALSLPFPLLPKAKAARVLAAVEERLYTPVGLRTLEPGHPDYDAASDHQGAVWAWLLGPYYSALVRVHGAAGRKKALAALAELRPRLVEAGVASLPEVFDPEPARSPRGSIARALGVAEVLRAYVEDLQAVEPKPRPKQQEAAVAVEAPKPAPVAAKPARGRAKKAKKK